ncbi:MAG: isoprenyl transferase [gamma proteobacterium symbiont of Bathyaustriella thionipta]|nr:isoprenyl transferase [gamma proteobacterium symbiont of Bathyaustriella thionipta]MCU7948583.1 isoprenyl transferase [gamma proteobacterium symbiont of Bathyaustriella thionipta]MCU7953296.1 isoprenyl transferase [gamma proteobacterium symbiont of Bathyaustriella thionipta]MCU7955089.1 isoprenyl transferase [gamma proteobacterium symbiont of Bathyaustriella thionipta]MCU7967015.1 isoprenyl transferase [gamma proteobacterium symbiont of Bathyaustriella thionipta]
MSADNPTRSKGNALKHICIIMDGNGRWAKKRFMPRFAGHKAGLSTVRKIVSSCVEQELEVLTIFAFSSENWRRPEKEVGLLMELFATALTREVKKLHDNNIQLRIIGDLSAFSDKIKVLIDEAIALTAHNDGLILNVAANYGGRWDIMQATQQVARKVQDGQLVADDIDEAIIEDHLSLSGLPEPDLFIRTGGEKRISNFILWQLAYCEFYFTDVLWPDFNKKTFLEAIDSFYSRQRRFGRTGDQLKEL